MGEEAGCSAEFGEEDADRFLTELGLRPRCGDAWTIRQLLRYLRDTGGVPVLLPEVDTSAKGKLIDAFGEFLRKERGLSASTSTNYLPMFVGSRTNSLAATTRILTACEWATFSIVRRAQAGSPGRTKLAVTALRSFLRFLQQRSLLATDLAVAVPEGLDRCRPGAAVRDPQEATSACAAASIG
ncbi:hypothetical protein O7A70_32915 [Mesorhizobium sp. Cs1299R1N1]|uniref:hypothetical protein n=1 Tax=Mesorhizobium sp. Cs1299R1N1 TaxID=3015172 RepID=UPI00301C3819